MTIDSSELSQRRGRDLQPSSSRLSPQALCQLEFRSKNLEASLKFFAHVLGWPALPMVLHEYVVLEVPADSPYGVSLVRASADAGLEGVHPQQLIPYFRWDALDSLIEELSSWGGKLIWGPRPVAGYGRTILVEDPGEIQLGFFTAVTRP